MFADMSMMKLSAILDNEEWIFIRNLKANAQSICVSK